MNTKRVIQWLAVALLTLSAVGASAAARYQYRVPLYVMKAAPALEFNVADVALAAQAGTTATAIVALRNTGNVPVGLGELGLYDLPSNVTLQTSCSGITLNAGQECSGQLVFSATAAGSWTGLLNATADNGVAASIPVTAVTTANPTTAHVQSVTVSPVSMVADGNSTAFGQATVLDAYGNVLGAGVTVTWGSSAGALAANTTVTNASGVATNTLTSSTVAGTAAVTAKAPTTAAASATVEFTADNSTATISSLTASQASLVATGSTTALMTAIVKDGNGNPMGAGLTVVWSTSLGSLTAATSTTNASGIATVTLTAGTTLGTATVSAVTPQNAAAKSVTVTFVPDTASAQVTGVSVSSPNSTAGKATNVVAIVQDAYGHALDGYPVYFSTTLGSITSPVTSVGGLATSSTTSASSGSATVRAYTSQQGVNNAAATTVTYTSACQTFFDEGGWSFVLRVNPGYSSGVWTTPVDYGGQLVLNGEWGPVIPPNGYADWRGYRYYIGTLQDYLYFEPEDPPKEAWSYIRCPL